MKILTYAAAQKTCFEGRWRLEAIAGVIEKLPLCATLEEHEALLPV